MPRSFNPSQPDSAEPRPAAVRPGDAASRRGYIDWLRGLAILVMIETHVLDSWTRPADRGAVLFGYAKVLGGFAAPLFLFLAGLSVILAIRARSQRTGDLRAAAWSVQRRGWEIFALAFVFRFQAWALNPAALPAQMLRVDILNIMGPSIALAAILCGRTRGRVARLVTFGAGTALLTLATPLVRAAGILAPLPDPLEAYLRPVPGYDAFTLFPWAGFVLAGAFVGTLLDRPRAAAPGRVFHAGLAAGGLVLAVGSYYAWYLPSPYAHTDFWTTSPAFFSMRVGIIVAVMGIVFFQQSAAPRTALGRARPMQRFGRSSLLVYWIHVELVYGVATERLHHRLSLEQAIIGFAVTTLSMFALVVVKDWARQRWKQRRERQAPPADVVVAT